MTKKVKLAIICSAAAVAVILAIVIPIAVVFGTRKETEKPKYTVSFDTRGGSEIASYKLEEGEIINKPADPAKEMFVFGGWYSDRAFNDPYTFGAQMPAHDITVYANWIGESQVIITYNANGGSFEGGVTETTALGKVGDAFNAIASPARTGYVFGGWYTDAECLMPFTASTYPAESFKLYAGWNADERYAYVSFYGNGSLLSVVPVEKGSAVPEYEFAADIETDGKWYTNAAMTVENTAQTASTDMDLYTAFYSKGLTVSNGTVMRYDGTSAKVYVPSKYEGQTVTTIGANAFYRSDEFNENYGHITEIVLPSTVTTIGVGAFYDCRYLSTINLTERVRTIGDNAFWHNERLKDLGDISNVSAIGSHAFTGCSVLRDITLPSTLNSLGAYAFSECTELREIVIPSNVRSIGEYAFDGCSMLNSVEIQSEALSSIGQYAFRNCVALEKAIVRSTRLPEFALVRVDNRTMYSPFRGCDKVQIEVAQELLENYKAEYGECDDGSLSNKFIGSR